MKTKSKKNTGRIKKQGETTEQRPKSKTTLFWEKYPNGIGGEIVNMRAVLK